MHYSMTLSGSFNDLAGILSTFLKKNERVFVTFDPPIVDFRKDYQGTMSLMGDNETVNFKIPKDHFASFVGLLTAGLFCSGKVIYSWDIKRFFSYIFYRLGRNYIPNCAGRFLDLRYIERFANIDNPCPDSYYDCVSRLNRAYSRENSAKFVSNVYFPLSTYVLPRIETYGLLDTETKTVRHTVYEIEGQTNGRLRCSADFPDALTIHNLRPEQRAKLKSKNVDNQLVTLDFRAQEVYVLAAFSGDKWLNRIIESDFDIYSAIFSLIYKKKGGDSERKFAKAFFLPIVYGISEEKLSSNLKISLVEAKELTHKVYKLFKQALALVEDAQAEAKLRGIYSDCLGRTREVVDEKYWVVRNMIISGPAAAVCMEKLAHLASFDVVATIHDAYILDVPKHLVRDRVVEAVNILEQPSKMIEKLRLKVGIKVGNDLANQETYVI